MLEDASLTEQLSGFGRFAPLKVVLPEELRRFYVERGYLATMPHEARGHARLNVRAQGYIRFGQSLVGDDFEVITTDTREGTILVKDISKTGIAILYHRQIFPCEQFEVFLQGRVIDAKAVRCRRIGPDCYETGAMIDNIASVNEADPD